LSLVIATEVWREEMPTRLSAGLVAVMIIAAVILNFLPDYLSLCGFRPIPASDSN
jgi:hypothetical protein